MAVAAINVLRTGGLGSVDFRDPGAVLSALNEAFPMSRHNDMYFTIWYGVYHAQDGWLEHASGGHPPALLLKPVEKPEDGHGGWEAVRLRVAGPIIGAAEGRRYRSAREVVPRGARLLVMSDGCYEVRSEDGTIYGYDDFERFVLARGGDDHVLGDVLAWARQSRGSDLLEDDFSMVRCCFEG
jgi:sigma-B regulation protein RsbU (phosphoserine phosphatase)